MSRAYLLAGNWKLHHAPNEAQALAQSLRDGAQHRGTVELLVFPTALSIPGVVQALEHSEIGVGVQEVETRQEGAFTGSNSAMHARAAGCTHALVGHSERRQIYGDTDDQVQERLVQSLDAGLLPVLCVGETLSQRESNQAEAMITRQLDTTLGTVPVDRWGGITIAYEPVWAIGTGVTATPAQAQHIHAFIRSWIADQSPTLSDEMRILYGGSVKPGNAEELLACPDIDGALIGGASLKANSFLGILHAAQSLT
jgi:triosephosphate isomerase